MKIAPALLSCTAYAVFFADALEDEGRWQAWPPVQWGSGMPKTQATDFGSSPELPPFKAWWTTAEEERAGPPTSSVYPMVKPIPQLTASSRAPTTSLSKSEPAQILLPGQHLPGRPEGLLQHRTRVPEASALAPSATLSSTSTLSAPAWFPGSASVASGAPFSDIRTSNTWRALQELAKQLNNAHQRPGGAGGMGPKYVVPVENVKNAVEELAKLSELVRDLCEAERRREGPHLDIGHVGRPIHRIGPTADRFPVEALAEQGASYSRRAEAHLRAARKLVNALAGGVKDVGTVARLVQEFRAATADGKEVYQTGSRVTSALLGGVLPFVSSCSFFTKPGVHETHKLWSLVVARAGSAVRYLHQAVCILRKVSPSLGGFVSGSIQPHSVEDFAKSKAFFKAAQYLDRAEARSISSVGYFNQLATAYEAFVSGGPTASATAEKGRSLTLKGGQDNAELGPVEQTEVSTVAEAEEYLENAEMSLMAEDLGDEYALPLREMTALENASEHTGSMQTGVDDSSYEGEYPQEEFTGGPEADDYELQTTVSD